jgi:hypothetical protein
MTIQGLNYERLLQISKRVNWRLEDIIGRDKPMDFAKPFLPESFARTEGLDFLSPAERLKLNQIRGYGYLSMFELVERCILPMVEDLTKARRKRTKSSICFSSSAANCASAGPRCGS